jgi:hypothetical protein
VLSQGLAPTPALTDIRWKVRYLIDAIVFSLEFEEARGQSYCLGAGHGPGPTCWDYFSQRCNSGDPGAGVHRVWGSLASIPRRSVPSILVVSCTQATKHWQYRGVAEELPGACINVSLGIALGVTAPFAVMTILLMRLARDSRRKRFWPNARRACHRIEAASHVGGRSRIAAALNFPEEILGGHRHRAVFRRLSKGEDDGLRFHGRSDRLALSFKLFVR